MFNISRMKIKTQLLPPPTYNDFVVRFAFGGNSSLISISNGESGIGSEHWILEESERFLFNTNGNLVLSELSVPNKNAHIHLTENSSCWGEIYYLDQKPFLVPPTKFRNFNAQERSLTCLNFLPIKSVDYVYIKEDFNFIFADEKYCGYRLHNPIRYLCETTDESLDFTMEPDEGEYKLMSVYLSVLSDNKLDKLNQNMASLIMDLSSKIAPRLGEIRCVRRRGIIERSLVDLMDFYL